MHNLVASYFLVVDIPEDVLGKFPTDRILDTIATEIIHDSLIFSVQLGYDASLWLGMKDDRYKIVDINREVLYKWRQEHCGKDQMGDLAQALCNIDVNISAILQDSNH